MLTLPTNLFLSDFPEKRKVDRPEVPKVSKTSPIIKCVEAFVECLCCGVGAWHVPSLHPICEENAVPADVSFLATNLPHLADDDSVEEDLIECTCHTHPLHCDDNAQVCCDVKKHQEVLHALHPPKHVNMLRMGEMHSNQLSSSTCWG